MTLLGGTMTRNAEGKKIRMPSPMVKLDAMRLGVDMLARVKDPAERLRAIRAFRAGLNREDQRLDRLTREAVLELRALDCPATWAAIGEILDVTPQRAYQLAAEYLNNNNKEAHS